MTLPDDVVERVARSIMIAVRTGGSMERDALAWELTDEELAYIARAALEAARYGEMREALSLIADESSWRGYVPPVQIDLMREYARALLSTIGESNLKGDRG